MSQYQIPNLRFIERKESRKEKLVVTLIFVGLALLVVVSGLLTFAG